MYACQVHPVPAGSTLEKFKQCVLPTVSPYYTHCGLVGRYWLFSPLGTQPESYNIVAVDHILDMNTRGWRNRVQITGGKTRSTVIDQLDPVCSLAPHRKDAH
jgi:hypothetical protein